VAIGNYDREGTTEAPLKVPLSLTGAWNALRVWLSDGLSDYTLSVSQVGGSLVMDQPIRMRIDLRARTVGTWQLWAAVTDPQGCPAQTGLTRTVTVR